MLNDHSEATKLTLSRKKQYMEANEPVNILVNGYLACQLKSGESKTINVFTHDSIMIQASLMRNKTPALEIDDIERDENSVQVSHIISNPIYFAGVALAILSTILIFSTGHVAYMTLVTPPAAIFLYFKFIKKDKYLKISKIKKQKTYYQPSEN
ncbi:MAG TPA: hypothetical protein VK084_04395 [Chitinophagaceae bacterium]|nr:hypothetical protein [Chitinophagaceae bacterium]